MVQIFNDWQALMGAILHWFNGGDPYGAYTSSNGLSYDAGYFAYPPPALLLAAPFALLPWWLSGLILQAIAVLGFERWAYRSSGRSALIWVLIFPPLLQGLQIGQTTLIALVALMFAELNFRERRDWRAGTLLALALLKPQVGALAIAYLLFEALRTRRWQLLGSFTLASAVLWISAAVVAGPQIYAQWFAGLGAYQAALPDRPMIFLPLGPLVLLAAAALWRRSDRDYFGLALLVNTLIYPLSVIYIVSALAFLVIRWRRDWELWPLALPWLAPVIFSRLPASADMRIAMIQTIVICALLVGLLPPLRRQPAPEGQTVLTKS